MPFDLDRIKAKLSIADVASRLGISIPRKGDAICPKHNGRSLRLKSDFWRCHGGCDRSGDIFDPYQFVTESEFREAAKELASWAGIAEELTPDDIRRIEHRRRIEDLLSFAALWYQSHYEQSPAQQYAKERGIDVDDAQLGYAPDEWQAFTNALRAASIDLKQAEEAGLIKQGRRGYYDRLRHRLVIPAFERGRCVYLQGRTLGPGKTVTEEEVKQSKYKNIALGEPPLYHINGVFRPGITPVVAESTTDVLRLSTLGLAAIGTYGASIKDHQRAKLNYFDQIYVALQNDTAGHRFADALAEALGEKIRIAPPPSEYKDWDEAIKAGVAWQADETLSWLRWKLQQISPQIDFTTISGKSQISPILTYLAGLAEHALVTTYLDELKKYFRWSRDKTRAYERQIRELRLEQERTRLVAQQLPTDDHGHAIDMKPDVYFINPAQAYYNSIVYVARSVTRTIVKQTRRGEQRYDVHEPVIITSDRRIIALPELPRDAPPNTLIYLDEAKTMALRNRPSQASMKWSYASVKEHIDGHAPDIDPHSVYTALLESLKSYVYFADPGDYVIAVLWAMGTYFHQLFDAFPYLAIHGHKGTGKTTLLHWLQHVAFNASHLVNTSEAALFRWIETAAPTMLIDEQEGLNSRQAAKENKADLMGILKAGYQKGAMVARQNMEDKQVTQQFAVYCPKALAAIDAFEDILEDRSILVYMHRPSRKVLSQLDLKPRGAMTNDEFQTIRDSLYLLLMQSAGNVDLARQQARNTEQNRFGELVLPLLTMAAVVDYSRDKQRLILDELAGAIERQSHKRDQRDLSTPEAMLKEAIRLVMADAEPAPFDGPVPGPKAQRLPDNRVVMDSLHISDAFKSLFPSARESYFRLEWLAKQVNKTDYIEPWAPHEGDRVRGYRWRRTIQERNAETGEIEPTQKILSVYVASYQE